MQHLSFLAYSALLLTAVGFYMLGVEGLIRIWDAIVLPPWNPPPVTPPGSWGGGYGPTGTRNSPGLAPGTGASLKPPFAQYGINQDILALITATGVPQRFQPIYIPPNTLVAIRAHNGTNAGNAQPVRIARQPEELLNGNLGNVLTPDTQISWPVDGLQQLWFIGTAADGIIVSLQRGRQ